MGSAIAADGSMEMQCQSCHGNMSAVGSSSRVGWIMEPNCQGCHTGTATSNSGQIRYTSVFDTNGAPARAGESNLRHHAQHSAHRAALLNLSLYRFSIGHGGLQCSACHGSTHAEFPSSHANDNLRNIAPARPRRRDGPNAPPAIPTSPNTVTGGPHGMHPVGQTWVSGHHGDLERSGHHAPNASSATAPITGAPSCRGCWAPAR